MRRVDLGRRRLLFCRSVARGPVLVFFIFGPLRVAPVATPPPRLEADLADHAGARVLRRAAFVLWALPADAELAQVEAGSRRLDRRELWPETLVETARPLSIKPSHDESARNSVSTQHLEPSNLPEITS